MPSKRRLEHLKKARLASVEHFKKQKLSQISPSSNTEQPRIEDAQSDICDTNNTEDDTEDETTWFWNESANETESDLESGGKSDEEPSLDEALPRTEEVVSMQSVPKKISWNQEGEDKLRGSYGKGSVSTLRRRKKSAQELEKEASKTYNITALWQRNRDLASISNASASEKLVYSSDSGIVDTPNIVVPLSQIPSSCTPPKSKWEIQKEQRIDALQDLTKLLQLVTDQGKKYGERLSPHSDFYRRHIMVQQFLQIQLKNRSSSMRRSLSLIVAHSFGRGYNTSRNIVRWENSWVDEREIPERKSREIYASWMDDEELKESIRDFARIQGDRLSSYKLVQYLKEYVNSEGIPNPIEIKSRTARNWLHKLGFEYKDVKKDVFIDGHERPDVVQDRENFLKVMKELEPYLVEFNEDGTMKDKEYPLDCAIGGANRRPVIVITHDESTFSANDGIRKAWTRRGDSFLRPKGKGQGIMASEFLLPFGRLNLSSLSEEKKKEIVQKSRLKVTEAVENFEYGKSNDGYWDGPKLHHQVIIKALPIAEALYPGYSLLFLFDNATSHSVYAQNAFRTANMNKGMGGKQPILREGWYEKDGVRVVHPMVFQDAQGTLIPKGIQCILQERGLWPPGGLNLECPKPKCFSCEFAANCKTCVKGHRCESCKAPKNHSSTDCLKTRKCDACAHRETICQCVSKKYCMTCTAKKGKCADCEELPPKCTSNSCCAKRLLSVQPDFLSQKCEIEESITNSVNGHYHQVIYYPKYHCELNHIEHFWCAAKQYARFWCEYSLNDLPKRVPAALASVSNHTCLAYYHRCQRKMELYREGLTYGSANWKRRTTHHKPTNILEDR